MKLFAALYLDEDVDSLIAALLRAQGFIVTTTPDARMLRQADAEQLAHAVAIKCAILTHNRVDFENLHKQYTLAGHEHFGIIIATRRTSYQIASHMARLLNTLTADEIANQLFYV